MKKCSIGSALFVLLLWLTPSYVGPSRLFFDGFEVFAAAIGILGLFDAVRTYRRNRYLEDIPTPTIRATPHGLAEVQGRVVPAEETIAAPFTERERDVFATGQGKIRNKLIVSSAALIAGLGAALFAFSPIGL